MDLLQPATNVLGLPQMRACGVVCVLHRGENNDDVLGTTLSGNAPYAFMIHHQANDSLSKDLSMSQPQRQVRSRLVRVRLSFFRDRAHSVGLDVLGVTPCACRRKAAAVAGRSAALTPNRTRLLRTACTWCAGCCPRHSQPQQHEAGRGIGPAEGDATRRGSMLPASVGL